jgi:hypothetical protein
MAEEKGCTMMARKRGAAIYVRVSTDGHRRQRRWHIGQ